MRVVIATLILLAAGFAIAAPAATACGEYVEVYQDAAGHYAYVGAGCGGLSTLAVCVDGHGRCPWWA